MTYSERVLEAEQIFRPRTIGLGGMMYPGGKGRFWRNVAMTTRPTWREREAIQMERNHHRRVWYEGLKRYARPD